MFLHKALQLLTYFRQPKVLSMLLLGIAAGIPLLLIFSSLSLWLREAGVERSAVTYFSWAALGYSFKFVWAPLVDQWHLPVLNTLLGRRRSWLLLSQLLVIAAISLMALIDPSSDGLHLMAMAAVLLGFSSATQDIVIDAYRIESADNDMQALLSSTYVAGYRIGMLLAGAGALYLASYWGSSLSDYDYIAWRNSYLVMAALMLIGVMTTLSITEPTRVDPELSSIDTSDSVGFMLLFISWVLGIIASFYFSAEWASSAKISINAWLGNPPLASFLVESARLLLALIVSFVITQVLIRLGISNKAVVDRTYIAPVKDFFSRYGVRIALLLLALIGFYRVSDIVLGVIANVFYQDMGFTKIEIATVVKSFGLLMTLLGGFLGGLLAVEFGVMRILLLGAVLSALTNLLFVVLAHVGHDITWLYIVISADNLSAGLASAAFIAFLSSLTNISFTAMQYAIFSSLMTLIPKLFGGYSGSLVYNLGYQHFFLITAVIGLPLVLLIVIANRHLQLQDVKIK